MSCREPLVESLDVFVLNTWFCFLHNRCALQMGGSDQWGNMVNGVDLGRRVDKADLFALTAPLITTSDGKKMGKSASGAVWLNDDRLPAYGYWQVHKFSLAFFLACNSRKCLVNMFTIWSYCRRNQSLIQTFTSNISVLAKH